MRPNQPLFSSYQANDNDNIYSSTLKLLKPFDDEQIQVVKGLMKYTLEWSRNSNVEVETNTTIIGKYKFQNIYVYIRNVKALYRKSFFGLNRSSSQQVVFSYEEKMLLQSKPKDKSNLEFMIYIYIF